MATGAEYEVTELGVYTPFQQELDHLGPGEVGYLAASIKSLQDAKVGDTVTLAKKPAEEPLAGFQDVKPMVFCGIFPTDSDQYTELRDALEKLNLNDAAFMFEPETSDALGFGFRCGFLGLLHMEIIQERLEREYNIGLITTAPSVVYRVSTEQETIEIDNPSQIPDGRVRVEEPYFKVSIHVPAEFVGSVIKLCQDRRGEQQGIQYASQDRVIITYLMPLAEVLFDFFDKLKSATKGYASMDYELAGYREKPARATRHASERQQGRRPQRGRPQGQGLLPRPRARREAQEDRPPAAIRSRHPSRHRLQNHLPRDRPSPTQRRHRQMLRRRHLPKAQAPRKAERG